MPCGENLDLPSAKEMTLIYTRVCTEQMFYKMVPVPVEEGACGLPVVHSDGSIEYPHGDPPDILGYTRSGLRFYPAWVSCRWRTLTVTHPNNCIAVKGVCGSPQSEHHLKSVQPEQCQGCRARWPIN